LAYSGTTWNDGGNGSAGVSNLKKSNGDGTGISVSQVLRPRTSLAWGSILGDNKLASAPAGLGMGSYGAGDSAIMSGFVDNGVVPSPTQPFSSWITGYHPIASDPNAAPDADPDGDGLKNSIEYVLGTLPDTSTPGGPGASTAAGDFVFTFQRGLASKNPDTKVATRSGNILSIGPMPIMSVPHLKSP
jgi:hypothetical protein